MTDDTAHCLVKWWRAHCVYHITSSEPVILLVGWLLVDSRHLSALARQWMKPLPLPCLPSWLASLLSQPLTQHTICMYLLHLSFVSCSSCTAWVYCVSSKHWEPFTQQHSIISQKKESSGWVLLKGLQLHVFVIV